MKKFISAMLAVLLFTAMTGCDLLSTIIAVKDFSVEYTQYSTLYSNTTYFTVQTETDITVSDTNIDAMDDMSTQLAFSFDKETPFTLAYQDLNGVEKLSVYENAGDYLFEYLIDGNVVTPTLPISDDPLDTNDLFTMDSLSMSDVQNELKLAEHSYEFDIYLSQVVNLEKLATFAEQLKVFDESLSSLDNAIAHVVITFTEVDSVIDIQATLTDYRIDFDETNYVVFSLTNHTVLEIPADFSIPDVFSNDYLMKPGSEILLARKAYLADTSYVIPLTQDEAGYSKFSLEAGTYDISFDSSQFDFAVYDVSGNLIPLEAVDSYRIVLASAQDIYLYFDPAVSANVTVEITLLP